MKHRSRLSYTACALSALTALAVLFTLYLSAAAGSTSSRRDQPRGNGSPSPVPLWVDGCDHNYGAVSGVQVCVPVAAPGGKPVDCAYLARLRVPTLRVLGQDDKKLAGGGRAAHRGELVCRSR